MKGVFSIFFAMLFFNFVAFPQDTNISFNKSDFYKAISSVNLTLIDKELQRLNTLTINDKLAFEGTLQMKKAGIVSNLSDKLSLFKAGHLKLEEAIKNDNNNYEYRFLRLIIQENAPSFLNYNSNIKEDSQFIIKNIATLSPEVQQAIRNYTKQSKALLLNE